MNDERRSPAGRVEPSSADRAGVVDEAVDWLRAIGLGIGDTARDMLEAGRQGAREATDRYWARFDRKTRQRREKK